MYAGPIALDDIESGLDRQQLHCLQERFLHLNRERHRRMLAGLTERQCDLVALLPLLFHVNHPVLPGYIARDTPAGLSQYQPEPDDIRRARALALSFRYQRDVRRPAPAIDALFVMGSVGTIAQSDSSDLDVWVCHRRLSGPARAQLQQKCQQLREWAHENARLDIHFFPMEPGHFHSGELGQLSEESSGSAQRYLLLDEFYRTAVWLGGRLPLWWFVPESREARYAEYADTLLRRRFIHPDTVIDFGGLPQIPEEEFIGAGIWQLYKGIDSPYKSVLKLMLLEVYCRGRNRRPLALDFKSAVYAAPPHPDALDPYVMVYRALETYLSAIDAPDRLELARRCLYFKGDKPLTRRTRSGEEDWQRRVLEQLVSEWGWSRERLRQLDERRHWKAPEVMEERRQLVSELSTSYRLVHALNQGNAKARIRDDELMLLGRKLHAAFERKAGKVEWLNPGISRDMAEPALLFVEESETRPNSPGATPVWALYRSREGRAERPVFKRSRHLLELLLWSYGNGILSATTPFDIHSGSHRLSAPQRQQLVQWLRRWLPLPEAEVPHEAFQRPAAVKRMLWVINLDVNQEAAAPVQSVAGYGSGLDASAMRSLDIVQRNSWGEIICRRLEGDLLLEGLQYALRAAPPGGDQPPCELTFQALGLQGNALSQHLGQLWQDLQKCFSQGNPVAAVSESPLDAGFALPSHSQPRQTLPRYILEAPQGHYLLIRWLQHQPQITRCDSYETLLQRLVQTQPGYSPILLDRHALKDRPLALIAQAARQPGVYVFYRVQGERAEVTLVDERGALMTVSAPFYSHAALLRPLAYFLRSAQARLTAEGATDPKQTVPGERLPGQGRNRTDIRFFEILGRVEQRQGYLEERNAGDDLEGLSMTDVQVIAEADAFAEPCYSVYCNGREFSALEHGDALFSVVVQDILSGRPSGERYPCYITDLDISQCRDWLAPQTGLQLSHYLELKMQLEQRLNAALQER